MKIRDVVDKVNRLQPNHYPVEDILGWCYEVTTDILADCPQYESFETEIQHDGGFVPLPEGVAFRDIAQVYLNGVHRVLRDERMLEDTKLRKGDVVNVVYRVIPEAYTPEEVLPEDAPEGAAPERVVPESLVTACPAPWDAMYMDYVWAQIALMQHDLEEYEVFISRYNVRFDAYRKWFGSNSPISGGKNFVNLY